VENRHVPTHIFSVQHAAPFSHDQGCANGPFHDATKIYGAEHNTLREVHLHDDRNGYGSETEAISPFFREAAGHKNGPMLHRKIMGQDQPHTTWYEVIEID